MKLTSSLNVSHKMPLDKFGRHADKSRTYYDDLDIDLDDDEHLNMRNKRIIYVAAPINETDAVNKKFVEEELAKIMDKLNDHIRRAEDNIQKANKIIREVTTDIEALFKHLNIKQ